MKISVAKREYLTEIEVRKITLKTIKSYRNSLNLFLRFCKELQKKTAARSDRFTDSSLEKLLVLVEDYKDGNVAEFLEKAVG